MRKILIFILVFLISNAAIANENYQSLSIQECLKLALENHPSIKRSKGVTRVSLAQLESLKVNDRITVNLTGSARHTGNYEYWDDNSHTESIALNASKLLYDNSQNKIKKSIQENSIKASRESEIETQISVAAEAKRAYYDLVLKILNRDVEKEKLLNLEEHLKRAQGLYEVGNSPFMDVTKAQADVASARVSLLKAENDILLSQEALKVAMGIDFENPFEIKLSTELLLPKLENNIDELITTALNDRPDYKKLLLTAKSNELSIKSAARSNSPTLTGTAGTSYTDSKSSASRTEYTIGLSLNVPVVDGGASAAAVENAKGQLDQTNAEIDSLRQTLTHEVRSAALSLKNATDRAVSSQASVKYAEESLELAQGRYEVGVGNALELSDAVSTLASSRYVYYQALFDAQTARADLDKALGHFPPEYY